MYLKGLEGRQYGVIYADPPWHFATYSETNQTRAASNHYPIMSLEDIKRLPVASHAAPDCVLFLWVIDPMLQHAFEVINAWGFKLKTVGFYWCKQNAKSPGWFTGLGYWTRGNPEQCWLATRGNPKRKAKDVKRLIVSPRREHSRKPDEVTDRIERLVDGPYLEMWARRRAKGWDTWGNEVDKFAPPLPTPCPPADYVDCVSPTWS